MRLRRSLAAVFASVALALAFVLWTGPGGTRPLMAASATCGGYSGPLCTKSESCIRWFFGLFETCSSVYTYYKSSSSSDGSTSDSTATDEKEEPATLDEQ